MNCFNASYEIFQFLRLSLLGSSHIFRLDLNVFGDSIVSSHPRHLSLRAFLRVLSLVSSFLPFSLMICDTHWNTASTSFMLITSKSTIHFPSQNLEAILNEIREDITRSSSGLQRIPWDSIPVRLKPLLGSGRYINSITAAHNIELKLNGSPIALVDQAFSWLIS